MKISLKQLIGIFIIAILIGIKIWLVVITPYTKDDYSCSNDSLKNMSNIQMFNSRFISHEGNQKGSSVKSLINSVNSSNIGENENGINAHLVDIYYCSNDYYGSIDKNEIKPSKDYNVKLLYLDGYISEIIVFDSETDDARMDEIYSDENSKYAHFLGATFH